MLFSEIRVGDVISIPKGVDAAIDEGYTGTVIGKYNSYILVQPKNKKYKTTIVKGCVSSVKLLMHKTKSTLEREYQDVINELTDE